MSNDFPVIKVNNILFRTSGNISFEGEGEFHMPDSSFLKDMEEIIDRGYDKFFNGLKHKIKVFPEEG